VQIWAASALRVASPDRSPEIGRHDAGEGHPEPVNSLKFQMFI